MRDGSGWSEHLGDRGALLRDLARARDAESAALSRQALIVQHLRVLGASWADIGNALGMSRQAARQRWGRSELST